MIYFIVETDALDITFQFTDKFVIIFHILDSLRFKLQIKKKHEMSRNRVTSLRFIRRPIFGGVTSCQSYVKNDLLFIVSSWIDSC